MSCFSVFLLLAQCLQKIFSGNFCLHILDTYSVLWELVRTGNTVEGSTHNLRWLSRAKTTTLFIGYGKKLFT